MSLSYTGQSVCIAQKPTSGFVPLVGVPPVGQRLAACQLAGGTPDPLRSRGGEFNELAPHTPERLRAPRFAVAHQRRGCRSPPTLTGMARHALPCYAPPKRNRKYIFRPTCSANEGTMAGKGKEYPQRLSVQVTDAMDNRLEQVARGRDEPKAEVVRAALRAFLDEQEDVIGSRKHFTKAFGRRIDHVEQLVSIGLWLNLQTLHLLYERLRKEEIEPGELFVDLIDDGAEFREVVNDLLDTAAARKTKPPA